jgi:hypothetical protein
MARTQNPYADMPPTEDAPYGFMPDEDGEPRPRKRRPRSSLKERLSADPDDELELKPDLQVVPDEPEEPEHIPDPEPKRGNARASAKPRPKPVTMQVRRDIEGKIGMMLGLTAGMLTPLDPYCFGALGQVTPDLARALSDLAVKSPDMVAWFTTSGKFMDWFSVATILAPVAKTVWQHHFTRTLGHEEEQLPDGYAYAAPPL